MTYRVLVIEPYSSLTDLLRFTLVSEDFELDVVTTVDAALAARRHHDVILLDWDVVGTEGAALCQALHDREPAPIVAYSTAVGAEEQALGLGCRFVSAPFELDDLISATTKAARAT